LNQTMRREQPARQTQLHRQAGPVLGLYPCLTQVIGRSPAEADMQRHFRVTPPSVHQMSRLSNARASSAASQASPEASSCGSARKSSRRSPRNPSNPLCRGTRSSKDAKTESAAAASRRAHAYGPTARPAHRQTAQMAPPLQLQWPPLQYGRQATHQPPGTNK